MADETEDVEIVRAQRDAAAAQRDAMLLELQRLREALEETRARLTEATGTEPEPVVLQYAVLIVDGEVPLHLERAVCQLGPIDVATLYHARAEDAPDHEPEQVRAVEFRAVDSRADAVLPLAQDLLEAAMRRGEFADAPLRIEQRRIESAAPSPSNP
jgi:hypothetical protein